jgi:hypothetical protein
LNLLGSLRPLQDEACSDDASLSFIIPTYNHVMDILDKARSKLSDKKFAELLSTDIKITLKNAITEDFHAYIAEKYYGEKDSALNEYLDSDEETIAKSEDSSIGPLCESDIPCTFHEMIESIWPETEFKDIDHCSLLAQLNGDELVAFIAHIGYQTAKKHYNCCKSKHTSAMILDQRINLSYCIANQWSELINQEVKPHLLKEFVAAEKAMTKKTFENVTY